MRQARTRAWWRRVVWLGLTAIYVQALLPLFIAVAIPIAQSSDAGGLAHHHHHQHHHRLAAHQDGAPGQTAPGGPAHHDGPHSGHGDCILCLGLQAGGPAALPAILRLPTPRASGAVFAAARQDDAVVIAAPVHYASRGPPHLG